METQEYPHQAIYNAMSEFYSFRQHQHQIHPDYLTKFKKLVKVIEHHGGAITLRPALIRLEAASIPQTKSVVSTFTDSKPEAALITSIPTTPEKAEQSSFLAS